MSDSTATQSEFYRLVDQADEQNRELLRPVLDCLDSQDFGRAMELLVELFSRVLTQAESQAINLRAQSYAFFALICGRLHEISPSAIQQRFHDLRGGFFADLACEAMIATTPEPAPSALTIAELRKRLTEGLDH
jgi:hypothetical protein